MNITMTLEEWEDLKSRAISKEERAKRKAAILRAARELASSCMQLSIGGRDNPQLASFIKVIEENV